MAAASKRYVIKKCNKKTTEYRNRLQECHSTDNILKSDAHG